MSPPPTHPSVRLKVMASTKWRKAVIEKIHMSENLCSGMNYSVVGSEFNVNESIVHIK